VKYLDYYQAAHEKGLFESKTLMRYSWMVVPILRFHKCKTVIDYGCGDGSGWRTMGNLNQFMMANRIELYDPGRPEFSTRPDFNADAVIMMDVLEHIPEDELPDLQQWLYRTLMDQENPGILIASFCNRPARKTFPDGTNVHVTQRPREFWRQQLEPFCKTLYLMETQ